MRTNFDFNFEYYGEALADLSKLAYTGSPPIRHGVCSESLYTSDVERALVSAMVVVRWEYYRSLRPYSRTRRSISLVGKFHAMSSRIINLRIVGLDQLTSDCLLTVDRFLIELIRHNRYDLALDLPVNWDTLSYLPPVIEC